MKYSKKLHSETSIWSMRIILPQHREAMRDHRRDLKRRERVDLDVDAIEEISRTLSEAMTNDLPVKIRIFDEYDDVDVRGRIVRFDQVMRRIRVEDVDFAFNVVDEVHVNLDDILSVELLRLKSED